MTFGEHLEVFRKMLFRFISAVITPPGLFTCFMVMMPMYGLYELSIMIVGWVKARA